MLRNWQKDDVRVLEHHGETQDWLSRLLWFILKSKPDWLGREDECKATKMIIYRLL